MDAMRFDSEQHPVLWVQSDNEVCGRINFLFARKYLSKYVARITGGCALMTPEQALGLSTLRNALQGFTGVGLFGGTSVRSRSNPEQIIDTVTEVFPSITSRMLRIGVCAKVHDMRYTPYGLVLHDDPAVEWFTTMNYRADALLTVQPSADRHAMWEDEFKQCVRIVDELQKVGWNSLLIVFNGGEITEKELLTWAALGRKDPSKWQVLLIKGSGRIADQYAGDKEFLKLSPTVHVVDCDPEALRDKLVQLNVFEER